MKNNSLHNEASENTQFKGVSSFDIKNLKTKDVQCDISEQLKLIIIPEKLEKDKEIWLQLIGKWIIDNIAIPLIQSSINQLAEGLSNKIYKNFNVNKISSFKSFRNYLQ